MPVAVSRADHQAHKDEIARLREQVAALERELRRARRCLAAERLGREQLRVRLRAEEGLHRLAHKLRDPKFYTARTKPAVNSGGVL